jgi:hypothetical protein
MKYSIPFIVLLIVACNNVDDKKSLPKKDAPNINIYKNKSTYSINIGDTIEIYHSTNSCCKYCQPNAEKLKHLDFIGSKIVIPEKKGCEGCNHTSALMFVAKSVGVDTIKDAIIPPMSICKDTIKGLSNYIVRIK